MDIFLARQPIFDRNLKTFGYELLFRGGLDNIFPNIDGDTASSSVLSNSFLCIGLDQLTGNRKAFINFTQNLLLKEVPCLFSPQLLFSEILENIEPDEALIAAVRRMTAKGCQFALDDFSFHEMATPLIRHVSIIKIDVQQTPIAKAKELIDHFAGQPIRFLAEKVETYEEFAQALQCGFSLFQGYFFSRPETIQERSIAPSKIHMLQIIREVNREDADIDRLETLIKTDLSLSYRLLKYLNSAYFNRPIKIQSIKEAILFLGLSEVKKLVMLIATAKLAESKPNELIRLSIMRAKLCEVAGQLSGYEGDSSELFLLGLFSLMNAILDRDMERIVGQLPLSDALKRALIREEGRLGCYLKLIRCYERGQWDACPDFSPECRPIKMTIEQYTSAIGWADAFAY
jgi:EAL and modified HD-GYP domain-containing signal transduction protein